WSSGRIEDMNRYSNFYHKGNNTHFFAPVIFASIIACAISLILVWHADGPIWILVAIDLVIAIGVLISVITLFRPMNIYFESKEYEADKLKLLVSKWLLYNQIRFVIIFVGLVIAIWALSAYQALNLLS
ncbi:MAG: DUF1772 domain-containing protein, partial [Saprospiraceae bacterium]|nr:DUF1772 domain-containing protein [Candidatus Opimibacter iunctus]